MFSIRSWNFQLINLTTIRINYSQWTHNVYWWIQRRKLTQTRQFVHAKPQRLVYNTLSYMNMLNLSEQHRHKQFNLRMNSKSFWVNLSSSLNSSLTALSLLSFIIFAWILLCQFQGCFISPPIGTFCFALCFCVRSLCSGHINRWRCSHAVNNIKINSYEWEQTKTNITSKYIHTKWG